MKIGRSRNASKERDSSTEDDGRWVVKNVILIFCHLSWKPMIKEQFCELHYDFVVECSKMWKLAKLLNYLMDGTFCNYTGH